MKEFSLSVSIILITLWLSACTAGQSNIVRKQYNPWENDIGYSQVVSDGDTLYISGITSEAKTMVEQVDEIYKRITTILNDYDISTDYIVKEVIYTTDIKSLKTAIPVRKKYFNNKYPSSSWIEVAGLWSKHHLVEIEIVARLNTD